MATQEAAIIRNSKPLPAQSGDSKSSTAMGQPAMTGPTREGARRCFAVGQARVQNCAMGGVG